MRTELSSPDRLVWLSAAAKYVEAITGERPHKATIYRWALRGLRGVRLRTTFAGGHRRTCDAWMREFFVAVTEAADGVGQAPPSKASIQRSAAIKRADQELRDAGI